MTPSAGDPRLRSYSQNAEDVRLWRVFKDFDDGFYVDVGAGHPVIESVTQLFYERGWSGINIEPGPLFPELAKARPRDVNLNLVVGAVDGTAELLITHPYPNLSTVDPDILRWSEHLFERVEAVKVAQRRLDSILAEHAAERRIDILKVDVEGAERAVLESGDWLRFRPSVVLVEAIRPHTREPCHEEWEHFLTANGYVFVTFDGVNRFYVSEESRHLAAELAYPVSVLDGFMPPGERLALEQLDALETELETVERPLRAQIEELQLEKELLRSQSIEANSRAALAEARLRGLLRSRMYRVGAAIRRGTAPTRPILLPAAKFAVGIVRVQRRASARMRRGARRFRPVDARRVYRRAIAPGTPWAFPIPDEPTPAPVLPRGMLAHLRTVLEDKESTPEDLAAAVADARRRRAVLVGDSTITQATGAAIVQAEIAGALRFSPNEPVQASEAPPASRRSVVVDARGLQVPENVRRGMGRHTAHILSIIAECCQDRKNIVFLIDPSLSPLAAELAVLADRLVAMIDPAEIPYIDLLVQPSPMTASPGPLLSILTTSGPRRLAVVYDFIPAEYPTIYLRTEEERIEYRARLEALARYDAFLPISEVTGASLKVILGRDAAMTVTGVTNSLIGLRPERIRSSNESPAPFPRYLVTVPSASDPRKNLLAVIAAFASVPRSLRRRRGLVVVGTFLPGLIEAARRFAEDCGIRAKKIAFLNGLSDQELSALYAAADLAIVPSFTEGLSLPVIEAICAGTPVVASNVAAHRELIGEGWWLAPPAEPVELGRRVARALSDPGALLEIQRVSIGERFSPEAVSRQIRGALEKEMGKVGAGAVSSRTVRGRGRPRVALIAPLPPLQSGVADYTAATFRAVAAHADVVAFSDSRAIPSLVPDIEVRPYSFDPYLRRGFDAVVSVVGNTHHHIPILEYFFEGGGPCIAHGSHMTDVYDAWRGSEKLAVMLSRHSDYRVPPSAIPEFLAHPDRLPSILYDEIASRAQPLVVHSTALAKRIREETGVEPIVIPYVPPRLPKQDQLGYSSQTEAREHLGWSENSLHIVAMGAANPRSKATEAIVDAVAWLRRWGVECQLHCVGATVSTVREWLQRRADKLGIGSAVHMTTWIPQRRWDLYLLAADAAVELRTYPTALSQTLLDCAAFGVPTVATRSLAAEVQAPAYVNTVSDHFGSLLVAECLQAVLDKPRRASAALIEEARRDWLADRTRDVYARRLLDTLGLWKAPA